MTTSTFSSDLRDALHEAISHAAGDRKGTATHTVLGTSSMEHDHEFSLIFGATKIDYDPDKEDTNRRKHGYSLESAVSLLQHILLPVSRRRMPAISPCVPVNGEIRQTILIDDENGKTLQIVTTMRENNTVRIISVRDASKEEREILSNCQ